MDVYGSLRDELSKLLLSLEKTSSPNLQALKEAKNIGLLKNNKNPFFLQEMEEGTLYGFTDQISSSSARDALLSGAREKYSPHPLSSSVFDEHSVRLEDSCRKAGDIERMGHSILDSLRKQREQLEHINFSVTHVAIQFLAWSSRDACDYKQSLTASADIWPSAFAHRCGADKVKALRGFIIIVL
ncbi:hypothetical protein DI09_4p70 [Mitosporidium daphniae]|uniref:Uncharacterized protein n=1 Tax=Mitosporidium daphniae TaxID=1485682 RepID=A0A098VQ72_9MICR|nr:uncharacterized protein DI09_4p70 [Mitosporidium daphniae]KGG50924.1 hypothetical protein DI09_4p70 [Mitosporidium daphniae]|eukprot:XP_013237404.1 uncharacterized protein DI09_4p70 [Mitosporidium daphniae]